MSVVFVLQTDRPKTGDPITVIDDFFGVGTGTVGVCEAAGFWVALYFCVDGQPEGHTQWYWYGDEGRRWVRGHTGEAVDAFLAAEALQ